LNDRDLANGEAPPKLLGLGVFTQARPIPAGNERQLRSVSNRPNRPVRVGVVELVVRLHYDAAMKDAVIPQVRVETELRASLDAVLRPGETLTDFVEVAVRNAVEYRRVQTDFASRCDASLAEYERTGVSIPAAQVIAKLESKLAKRRKQLGG
jgi:hypothetical protein